MTKGGDTQPNKIESRTSEARNDLVGGLKLKSHVNIPYRIKMHVFIIHFYDMFNKRPSFDASFNIYIYKNTHTHIYKNTVNPSSNSLKLMQDA